MYRVIAVGLILFFALLAFYFYNQAASAHVDTVVVWYNPFSWWRRRHWVPEQKPLGPGGVQPHLPGPLGPGGQEWPRPGPLGPGGIQPQPGPLGPGGQEQPRFGPGGMQPQPLGPGGTKRLLESFGNSYELAPYA